jgi:tryptophan-rich sensory protein
MLKKLKPYIISVAISLGVGGLASLLTMGNMDIYTTLNTPPLSPPGWLFPVVWTVLYTLMGISAAIIYTSNDVDSKSALTVYAAQLIVNFFWSLIFFNMRAFLFAFVWILLLDLLVIIMIMKFYRISPISAYLQIPYLVWILFASYLNLGIFLLNR